MALSIKLALPLLLIPVVASAQLASPLAATLFLENPPPSSTYDTTMPIKLTLVLKNVSGAPVITTHIEDLNAITPGPDPNFVIHNTVHTTVSATGEVTAQSFNFFSECKSH